MCVQTQWLERGLESLLRKKWFRMENLMSSEKYGVAVSFFLFHIHMGCMYYSTVVWCRMRCKTYFERCGLKMCIVIQSNERVYFLLNFLNCSSGNNISIGEINSTSLYICLLWDWHLILRKQSCSFKCFSLSLNWGFAVAGKY